MLPLNFLTMTKLKKRFKKAGYKLFGNKYLHKNPIFAMNAKWFNTADKCDQERILEAVIGFCKKKLKDLEENS